jgi:hypothetical protein
LLKPGRIGVRAGDVPSSEIVLSAIQQFHQEIRQEMRQFQQEMQQQMSTFMRQCDTAIRATTSTHSSQTRRTSAETSATGPIAIPTARRNKRDKNPSDTAIDAIWGLWTKGDRRHGTLPLQDWTLEMRTHNKRVLRVYSQRKVIVDTIASVGGPDAFKLKYPSADKLSFTALRKLVGKIRKDSRML